jgi:acid stress-induced BolA-like protein IbaG/YrbA
MTLLRASAMAAALIALPAPPVLAQGFKFSQPDESAKEDAAKEAARQAMIADQLSTPCRAELKGKKIMVIIGQVQSNGYIAAQQQNYGPHYQAINKRLQALGLRTYTPEEIRAQIKQAEIDAYFKNDPDAMLSASRRLGASFILRGLITTQSGMNPMMPVNQVMVNMAFTLTTSGGRVVSDVDASNASYSGMDVSRMALTLVNEKADEVVAQLYGDYCRNAPPPASRAAQKPKQ